MFDREGVQGGWKGRCVKEGEWIIERDRRRVEFMRPRMQGENRKIREVREGVRTEGRRGKETIREEGKTYEGGE